ncbi:MAG: DUF2156 domain-containing protein [Pirellulales bacterium]
MPDALPLPALLSSPYEDDRFAAVEDGPSYGAASDAVARMAYEYGQTYDAYLAAEPNRRRFWSSDGLGVLSYVRYGRHLKVGGGLLGPPEARERLLREFLADCRRRRRTASFFVIPGDDVGLFEAAGCTVTKWGEDPLVDLSSWSCRGKRYDWLRRQENFCRRAGLTCEEWDWRGDSPVRREATFAEIHDVSQDWLARKPQRRPLGFFNGEPTREALARQRVFLVRGCEGGGRLEAFVTASPYRGGTAWALDIYRHRSDAVRGAVPFAMLEALRTLQVAGVEEVSLCMVAALGCGAEPEQSSLTGRLLNRGARMLSPLFDLAGMHHYKSRFRPRFEPRYLCVWPAPSLMNTLTTFHLTGVTNFSWKKLAHKAWRQLRQTQRRTLAKFDSDHGEQNAAAPLVPRPHFLGKSNRSAREA